jgi:hypothetical protein
MSLSVRYMGRIEEERAAHTTVLSKNKEAH